MIATLSGGSREDGWGQFVSDGAGALNEWGGYVKEGALLPTNHSARIKLVGIGRWLKLEVVNRYRPRSIVMKIDAEGSDLGIIESLLSEDVFCDVSLIMAERHLSEENFTNIRALGHHSRVGCKTVIIELDDESFFWCRPPLPPSSAELLAGAESSGDAALLPCIQRPGNYAVIPSQCADAVGGP